MNLSKVRLLSEDEHAFHLDDGSGKGFPVHKKYLRPETLQQITQHFARGGVVRSNKLDAGEDIVPDEMPTDAGAGANSADVGAAAARGAVDPLSPGEVDAQLGFNVLANGLRGQPTAATNPAPQALQDYVTGLGGIMAGKDAIDRKAAMAGLGPPPGPPGFNIGPTGVSQNSGPIGLPSQPMDAGAQRVLAINGALPTPQASPEVPPPAAQAAPVASLQAKPKPTGGGVPTESEGVRAEREAATVAENRATAALPIQEKAEGRRAELAQNFEQQWKENQGLADKLANDIATERVDPNRFWHSQSLAGKIASGVALVLGGIGAGLTGGPNLAMNILGAAVDRDIDAQKANLGKKQSLLSHYLQRGHNIQQAAMMAKSDAMDALAGQMQMVATKFAGPEARANADKAIAQLKTQAAQARQQAWMQQAKLSIDAMEAQAKMAAAGAAGKAPAKEVTDVGKYQSAAEQVQALFQLRKGLIGPASGATQFLPGTDAAKYRDAQQLAGQAVGLILEGGKLSDRDKPFYMDLMPTAGDSDDRAAAKLKNVKDMLARKAASDVEALKQGGYNVGGLEGMARPPVQKVPVIGPKGERGMADVKEIDSGKYPGWRRAE
jgi:hypothetical protein